jgi:dimethylhistidine N-methyltransferase
VAYTAVDISSAALLDATDQLARRFPGLQILPVCADFTRAVELPAPLRRGARTVAFFPGSTLGNFEAADAVALLDALGATVGADGRVLLGLDLVKAADVLEAAYNDAAGVTAQFTLNLLERLNREAGARFVPARFRHVAAYNAACERIETTIVSTCAQTVRVGGMSVPFAAGEPIHVEISQKYTHAGIRGLAAAAGFQVEETWTDVDCPFALVLLRPAHVSGMAHG